MRRMVGGDQRDVYRFNKKGPWTPEEDALLLAFVEEHGPSAWSTAQYYFPELRRTGRSCRLRYLNHLQPGIEARFLSPEEERFILQGHAVLGNQWPEIAASLVFRRTENIVQHVARRRNGVSGPAGRAGGGISAQGVQMAAGTAWGRSRLGSSNRAALPQGLLAAVRISFQGLPVGPELPSVQLSSSSLGGSATAHQLGSFQLQERSFDSDLLMSNHDPVATAVEDLMEALDSVNYGTSADDSGAAIGAYAASDDASVVLPMEYSNAPFDGLGMIDLANVIWDALPDLEDASV